MEMKYHKLKLKYFGERSDSKYSTSVHVSIFLGCIMKLSNMSSNLQTEDVRTVKHLSKQTLTHRINWSDEQEKRTIRGVGVS